MEDVTKRCKLCSEAKPLDCFHKHAANTFGRANVCKDCRKIEGQQYYKENCEKIKKRVSERSVATIENRLSIALYKAKGRRAKNFALSLKVLMELYEKQKGLCAYTGLPLSHEANQITTASIDRIDSSKDYTPDNVQLIGAAINRMKLDLAESQFLEICELITNNRRKTTQTI